MEKMTKNKTPKMTVTWINPVGIPIKEQMKTLSEIYDYIFTEVQAKLDAEKESAPIEAQKKGEAVKPRP